MDPGEALFKGLVRLWRRMRGVPLEPPGPHAAMLADHADRLALVSGLLFGEILEVGTASGVGGAAGRAVLLPPHVDLFDDAEANAGVYVYRVAWGWASRACGYEGAALGRDPLLDALITLLAVRATRDALHDALPGTREKSARLEQAVLATRARGWASQPSGALELLVRQLLGDANAGDDSPRAVREWLAEALAVRAAGSAELRREAERLFGPLLAASGRGEPPPGVVIWGELLPALRDSPGEEKLDVEQDAKDRERKVIELDRTIRLERRALGAREDRPLYHVFEKIETAEEYGGQTSTPDATGDASKTEDAIRELSLGTVVRTADDPKNLVRADVVMEPTELEAGATVAVDPRAFLYPEWSYKDGAYREDHCTVVEERWTARGAAATQNLKRASDLLRPARRQVDAIRGHLLRALFRRHVRNRQLDGPEIDVEAMVERHADLTAGYTPPDRLYLASRKRLREIAILVLLDTSWSTDAWLDGRRVLDVGVSSLLVVAEAFEGYIEEEVAVASFRSHTRNDVRFGVLKAFADPWQKLRAVAPGVTPYGYTRIGAAIRHSTAILDAAKASKKLLLIVSDGKPTDYDRYEGRYGIEDVAQAVRESHQRRIHTFGIAIEKEAKLYLARMLGPGAYRILPRPSMLPDVMADVFLSVLVG